jgi:hypothetical protein
MLILWYVYVLCEFAYYIYILCVVRMFCTIIAWFQYVQLFFPVSWLCKVFTCKR